MSALAPLPYANALAKKIALTCGDITKLHVDAIVNAANSSLLGGGGVDGAIHRAANDKRFLEECRQHNVCRTLMQGCATGEAKRTNAYNLPCKAVIHTVGPVYAQHAPAESKSLLQAAYRNSLQVAADAGLRSVVRAPLTQAFPAISTGVYGYPKAAATDAALEQVKAFLEGPSGARLDLVVFCCFSPADLRGYEEAAPKYFS
ncbi:hypothetical protein MOBT1_000924 [Malassezia obtusa]|uniref:Macro domain-containing protein n=1 Tax=Malassezia obtusa TaxID=76774 RepID=A0AAF0DX81_9BASI|nr:hypothetical protein MOBT1_000924 [Malassezia obtusa]